ncbi:DUF2399 domain-containing protein [Alkalibacterium kapii]|uniref:DUF2399 domain-containing protein n=1 Tax=Alkalibacterium kapii TaxID=426704 RepID=A0A511ASB8_9LACT|nr:DUF2399 domain-containing protein [Alkalibacterium kapii]GEK91094.1 hypothetical protein AKA01nite_07160 [Alkalibacterium kapii]
MYDREYFLSYLQAEFPLVNDWLFYLIENSDDIKWIIDYIEESPETFEQMLLYLSEGIRLLPTRPISLSVFSQIITLDANAFNPTRMLGKLWLHLLAETKRLDKTEPVMYPKKEEDIDVLLQDYLLFREDISDSVTLTNLFAETRAGYHPVWEAAAWSHSVLTIPLREIGKLKAIYPAHEQPIVWVVDDAEVFSRITDRVPVLPMICTRQKWTRTAWEVFDRLIDSGSELRFIGDLTPLGVVRAEELLLRYPGKVRTWHMDIKTYLKAKDTEVNLTESDYMLLKKQHVDYLATLKDEMRDQGHPGNLIIVIDDLIEKLTHYYRK